MLRQISYVEDSLLEVEGENIVQRVDGTITRSRYSGS